MAYQKTAKDLAWDRERIKLQSEIQKWQKAHSAQTKTVKEYQDKCAVLENRITDLEQAIIELTEGQMTPDEAVKNMRKNAELSDMVKFLVNGSRGLF